MKSWVLKFLVSITMGIHFCGGAYADSYEKCHLEKIKLETLQGHEIASHIQEMVWFINNIYREYPYFYNGEDTGYTAYLESFPNLEDVIVCLAFEDSEVVGIAVGLPMPQRQVYQEALLEHGYDLASLFYLGEFGLKPECRGQGIEESMYQSIESFATQSSQFNKICFWEVESPLNLERESVSYFPSHDFWEQLGFNRHGELNFCMFWTNISDNKESAHTAVYWIRDLKKD